MHKMIKLAKWENVWRGVDYYKNRKVVSWFESTNDMCEKIYTGRNWKYETIER